MDATNGAPGIATRRSRSKKLLGAVYRPFFTRSVDGRSLGPTLFERGFTLGFPTGGSCGFGFKHIQIISVNDHEHFRVLEVTLNFSVHLSVGIRQG